MQMPSYIYIYIIIIDIIFYKSKLVAFRRAQVPLIIQESDFLQILAFWRNNERKRRKLKAWKRVTERHSTSSSYMFASPQHSSDRPVNIAKLKPHNLWAVWSKRRPGAIPWIIAPLTRLELRRVTVRPVLFRLPALSDLSFSLFLPL